MELSSSLDASAEEEAIVSLELCSEELCVPLLSEEVTAVAEEDFVSEEEAGIEVPWLEAAAEVCTAEEDCAEVPAEDDSPREEVGPITVPQLASTTAVNGKRNKVVRFTKTIIGHGHGNGDSGVKDPTRKALR